MSSQRHIVAKVGWLRAHGLRDEGFRAEGSEVRFWNSEFLEL